MKLAKSVIFGAWLIVIINLLMAFGAIGVFNRMTPAIANILSNNERSLQACEEMLAALVFSQCKANAQQIENFKAALDRAQNNITEEAEPEVLSLIAANFTDAFAGNTKALQLTTESILKLGEIKRKAMDSADNRATQLGKGGAWGIVFMAITAFLVGVIFIRNLKSRILLPLDEIREVLKAILGGETKRRCAAANLPDDIRAIFGSLNSVLDRCIHDPFKK